MIKVVLTSQQQLQHNVVLLLPWMPEVFKDKSRETAISEAQSGEERENRLDILFAAKENLWDQGMLL